MTARDGTRFDVVKAYGERGEFHSPCVLIVNPDRTARLVTRGFSRQPFRDALQAATWAMIVAEADHGK